VSVGSRSNLAGELNNTLERAAIKKLEEARGVHYQSVLMAVEDLQKAGNSEQVRDASEAL
jgi:hypothetical protein